MRSSASARRVPRPFRILFVEGLESRLVPGFLAAPSYDVGITPLSVAVGDFNGDGRLDLVVANADSYNVSVFLGNGDGTFKSAQNFTVGRYPVSVAVGDFNGDGRLDLAVTNLFNDNVSVLLGNGDGTFQPAQNFPAGAEPTSVAVGDFNGDGHLDLAVVGFRTMANYDGYYLGRDDETVRVLLGNGDGTFQAPRTFNAGSGPSSVAVGDFNGDGHLDLAVVDGGNYLGTNQGVSVLLGNGDGTFQSAQNFPVDHNPVSVAVGDFNGDGRLDLAVANYGYHGNPGNTVSVLLGNGDGTFQSAQSFPAGSFPTSVAVGDFNDDGRLDLAVANTFIGSTVSVLLGNGDGTFQSAQNFPVDHNPTSVAVGDFNGDGWPDLAVPSLSTQKVSILLNDGVWMGPSPPPGGGGTPGGGRLPGLRPGTPTPLASSALLAEIAIRLEPNAAASVPPAATDPRRDAPCPLFGWHAPPDGTRVSAAVLHTADLPAQRVRAQDAARWLTVRLFATAANDGFADRSAEALGLSGW